MAKFHITKKGEPGVCQALYSCPLGGEDEHFGTREEAQRAYEAKMTSELLPAGKSKADLGVRELNALAKVSSDPDVIDEVLARGSDRTFKNLAKNPNADKYHLMRAHKATTDQATRDELAAHPAFPVGLMSGPKFGALVSTATGYDQVGRLTGSDEVTDAHVDGLLQASPRSPHVNAILRNPNNKLSQEKVVELAERSWSAMGSAQLSNRYPADRIKDLPKDLVYWGTIDNTANSAYLDGYADWAIGQKDKDAHSANYYAARVAGNPETSSATLQKLAEADLATVEVYKHPRATPEVRALCEFKDPEVRRVAKLDRLQEQFGGRLKEEITYVENTNHPFGRNRGISDTRVRFNTERMAELGLDSEDIMTFMGRGRYNGGASFDPATGMFRGTVDSTD